MRNIIFTSLLGIFILILVVFMGFLKESWKLWRYDWVNHVMLLSIVIVAASMIVIISGNMITDNFPIKIVMEISGADVALALLPWLAVILYFQGGNVNS